MLQRQRFRNNNDLNDNTGRERRDTDAPVDQGQRVPHDLAARRCGRGSSLECGSDDDDCLAPPRSPWRRTDGEAGGGPNCPILGGTERYGDETPADRDLWGNRRTVRLRRVAGRRPASVMTYPATGTRPMVSSPSGRPTRRHLPGPIAATRYYAGRLPVQHRRACATRHARVRRKRTASRSRTGPVGRSPAGLDTQMPPRLPWLVCQRCQWIGKPSRAHSGQL
jgi:hypothetical protein